MTDKQDKQKNKDADASVSKSAKTPKTKKKTDVPTPSERLPIKMLNDRILVEIPGEDGSEYGNRLSTSL